MNHPCRILIPCKPLGDGKSRLSGILGEAERRALCEQLFERTLRLAKHVARPEDIFVVTRDPLVETRAAALGINTLPDTTGELNNALFEARDLVLRHDDLLPLIILPIDLVFADETALRQTQGLADVVIASDSGGTGTNLLVLSGAARRRFTFNFGPNSLQRHITTSRERGLTVQLIRDERLQFDLDGPEDYVAVENSGCLNQELVA
jgi:2-phospho-L-lactate/phosphoenolpyruvate guanylyltransferase